MKKILVIEDDPDILKLLAYNLENGGFQITKAQDGQVGKELALENHFDLIILDLMLPSIDGLELCKIFREESQTKNTPIMMVTAKGEEIDKILGFEFGADDYVTKPFSVREVMARIKALLKRSAPAEEKTEPVKLGTLSIDFESHMVSVQNKKVDLSPLEFKLLKFFITQRRKVYSREELLNLVWGENRFVEPRTVDVHIRRLREKIAPEGERHIKTIRGAGYIFSVDNDSH